MPRKKTDDEPKRRYRHPGLAKTATKRQLCGCRAEVWSCIYDGWPLQLDVYDLSQFGEVQALLLKIPTYHLINGDITRRCAPAITRAPVPYIGRIVREHRCGMLPPSADASFVPYELPHSQGPGF